MLELSNNGTPIILGNYITKSLLGTIFLKIYRCPTAKPKYLFLFKNVILRKLELENTGKNIMRKC